MKWHIPLFDPDLGQQELDAVSEVIRSKWLTMGEMTVKFEDEFSKFVACSYSVAVNSCTAALHMALLALGVGPGDEVVCPSLTFVATANAIRYCGARPVFADVASYDNWNVCVDSIESVVTSNTKALIVVHYAGYPCDMKRIMNYARSKNLSVVEDVAHAPGASIGGLAAGAWGDAGCFSFFSNKNMTTGEGGMLTTNRVDVAERSRRLRSHGMTTLTLDRHKGHAFSYDVVDVGYNYRMGEINAALGLAQLASLSIRNNRRRILVEHYRRNLAAMPSLRVPFSSAEGESAYHLMPVLLPDGCDRNRVMEMMKTAGVQTSIHYRPVDTFTSFQEAGYGSRDGLPITHHIGQYALTLPLYPGMSVSQVDYVCESLGKAMEYGDGVRTYST